MGAELVSPPSHMPKERLRALRATLEGMRVALDAPLSTSPNRRRASQPMDDKGAATVIQKFARGGMSRAI